MGAPVLALALAAALAAGRSETAEIVEDEVWYEAADGWVRHVVIPWERFEDVAERFGVAPEALAEWNRLEEIPEGFLRAETTLWVRPEKHPKPRQLLRIEAGPDTSWKRVSRRYGVPTSQLKAWNRRTARRGLREGAQIRLWMESSLPGLGAPIPSMEIELPEIPEGGLSVGRPNRGRLIDGVALPPSELYEVRIPYQSHGSTYTVRATVRALADFRRTSGFRGPLVVSAMSRAYGRRLPPHRSHQSGRDVDVWLPAMPFHNPKLKPRKHEVDWHAAWQLINAFARTGAVKRIYLDHRMHRRLRRASKSYGVGWSEWQALVHPNAIVVHAADHIGHIHVRFKCAPNEPKCRG